MRQRFIVSSAIDAERLERSNEEKILFGKANYSWKLISKKYSDALCDLNYEVRRIIRPEIYQSKVAKSIIGLGDSTYHLAVKPVEHIRQIYGAYNIFVSGWEFPELCVTSWDGNPFNNQVGVLRHADSIWCWSDYTRDNLRRYGLEQAITLPPPAVAHSRTNSVGIGHIDALCLRTEEPVQAADIIPLERALSRISNPTVFISVLNPFDRRKQFPMMIRAFLENVAKHQNAVLIVKLIIDNEGTTLPNIQEILRGLYDCHGSTENIIFIGAQMSDEEMAGLNSSADFYLCTSSTEGLNLPLIEAMSVGVIPVSTSATAMGDYIDPSVAIVVEHAKMMTDGPYHFLHERLATSHFPPVFESLVEGLGTASSLDKRGRSSLSQAASHRVHDRFGLGEFQRRVVNTLGGISK